MTERTTSRDWRRFLSLTTRGARTQFFIAVGIALVLPLMSLLMLYNGDLGVAEFWQPNRHLLAGATIMLVFLGYALIARYPITIVRLRRYLQAIISGEMPEKINLVEAESDIHAIQKSLNIILSQLRERLELTRREKDALEAELRQAQKLKALGTASAGIAHELKTPIQFVSTNTRFFAQATRDLLELVQTYRSLLDGADAGPATERARTEARAAEQQAKLDFLADELERAVSETEEGLQYVSHAIDAMRDFSHIRQTDAMCAEDLNAMVESTVTVSRNVWKHAARLQTDLDPTLPAVVCFGGDIRQVFLNLIVNAAHAVAAAQTGESAQLGSIRIRTSRQGGWAEVRVTDDGPGIPADIKNRIFEPFFTTKSAGQGTGQGLAIAHSIVTKKHGGTLDVQPNEPRGTTFIVRLPLENGTRSASESTG